MTIKALDIGIYQGGLRTCFTRWIVQDSGGKSTEDSETRLINRKDLCINIDVSRNYADDLDHCNGSLGTEKLDLLNIHEKP